MSAGTASPHPINDANDFKNVSVKFVFVFPAGVSARWLNDVDTDVQYGCQVGRVFLFFRDVFPPVQCGRTNTGNWKKAWLKPPDLIEISGQEGDDSDTEVKSVQEKATRCIKHRRPSVWIVRDAAAHPSWWIWAEWIFEWCIIKYISE